MVFIEIHLLLLCLYLKLCIPLFKGNMTWLLVNINKLQCEKKNLKFFERAMAP